jgi:diguanylate cyclase (GGDEF)-like protein
MQNIALLYDASQAVLSTFDLDEVLQQILAIARDYFHLKRVAILLLDKQAGDLYVRSEIGWDPGANLQRLSVESGLTGAAARLKRPIYAPDVSKDPRYVASAASTRSELAIPLMVRDEVVGVLDCQSANLDHFEHETIDLLTLFSTQASMALQNARLYSLERHRATQLQAINAIARQTTAVLDLDELLPKVCRQVLQAFHVDHVSVLLCDEEGIALSAHEGKLKLRLPEGRRPPSTEGIWAEAIAAGEPTIERNSDTRQFQLFEGSRIRMGMPLVSFGQTLGVLILDSVSPHAFHDIDAQTLESVADIVAAAIQNVHYVQRVKQLAYIDGLTGIFNRRYFELRIGDEIERARRSGQGMGVILIDIDQFKRLNDEFGHLLGDEVLRQVVSIFSQQVRKTDIVCRYGGEEFVIVLSQTDVRHTLAVAEKLRRAVERYQFPGVPRPVTISAGASNFPDHGVTRDELVKLADEALYSAKQAGRNRAALAQTTRFATVGS